MNMHKVPMTIFYRPAAKKGNDTLLRVISF